MNVNSPTLLNFYMQDTQATELGCGLCKISGAVTTYLASNLNAHVERQGEEDGVVCSCKAPELEGLPLPHQVLPGWYAKKVCSPTGIAYVLCRQTALKEMPALGGAASLGRRLAGFIAQSQTPITEHRLTEGAHRCCHPPVHQWPSAHPFVCARTTNTMWFLLHKLCV